MAKILGFHFYQGLFLLRDSNVSQGMHVDWLEKINRGVNCHQRNARVDLLRVFLDKSNIGLKSLIVHVSIYVDYCPMGEVSSLYPSIGSAFSVELMSARQCEERGAAGSLFSILSNPK